MCVKTLLTALAFAVANNVALGAKPHWVGSWATSQLGRKPMQTAAN